MKGVHPHPAAGSQPQAWIGKAVARVDGPLKVRGAAQYAADYAPADLLHGFIFSSPLARGHVLDLDLSAAQAVPGVVKIFTHKDRPPMAWFNRSYKDQDAPGGQHFRPLYDDEVHFSMQALALVVATSWETARLAASLIKLVAASQPHETSIKTQMGRAKAPRTSRSGIELPHSRGHAQRAFAAADIQISAHYSTPVEHHNPMEPHASTVLWEGDGRLTIYDKTQGVQNCQSYLCHVFGLRKEDVRVHSPYVGGAFGSGLRPQHQLVLAVMAALSLERSVRVGLTRQQMFSFGHRPATEQHLQLAADAEGRLKAIVHSAACATSHMEEYVEQVVNWSGLLYECADVELDYKLVHLDLHSPLDMRAPGASVGMFALESAMDELAVALHMDPLKLRQINYTGRDQSHHERPISTKQLATCYQRGAEKFGWASRSLQPRSMRAGHKYIGWGMASGVWEAGSQAATAAACLSSDGHLTVSSATADLGTGTYTIMAQIAAETLGLQIDQVSVQLGDSDLPQAPLAGGSWTAVSVGNAVRNACLKLRERIFALAREHPESPFMMATLADVDFACGSLVLRANPAVHLAIHDLLSASGQATIEARGEFKPSKLQQVRYTSDTHSAVFAEVQVDEDLGMIEVSRVVCAVDAGRILNPKTARSQILGGVVWGIGMALHEQSLLDHRLGRFMNHSFAEYHIPVARDIGSIDVLFIEDPDTVISDLGAKGLGEIGVVGTAAAVANAVYHATGKRVRDLPITPDKLI